MNTYASPAVLSDLERDNEGFLLDPDDWSPEVARALAIEAKLELTDAHWQVIEFIRTSYEDSQVVPEARKLLRYMKSIWGSERATRRYLYGLFPTGYGQTACKIAGMRKPLKLMLDI
ncbi:MAG: TusE/DsrC/DsvC family sulfur relay protein [Gammaproteobacteria bacterium]|jgi:tRNA 2-thiouridine synthesizing protein E